MKKRIVFVAIPDGAFGGAEKYLSDLIRSLDLSSLEVIVLCYGADVYTRLLKEKHHLAVSVHRHGCMNSPWSVWMTFLKLRPSVIVFNNGQFGVVHWLVYLAARGSGAKCVVAIEHSPTDPPSSAQACPEREHQGPVGWVKGRLRRMANLARALVTTRMAGLVCDKVICVSNAVRDRLVQDYRFPAQKTITVLNGVDLKHYRRHAGTGNSVRQRFNIDPSDPVLVCLTRFVPGKRVDVLLHAMVHVLAQHRRAKCLLVGTGKMENELRSLCVSLGLSLSVMFAGFAEDIRPYLEASDLLVVSSEKEGLPLALLEAMAFGLPCVATDAGGNKEAVVEGKTGLIVPIGSVEELAKAISLLLANPGERERMGVNALRRACDCFNIENTMATIRAILLGQAISIL